MIDCIFCKIVHGDIPCYKVFEDELFLGFLDVNPRTQGHSLVIPKKHYVWVYDVPQFLQYWQAALKLTRAMQKALNPLFVTYATHGLEVPHAHIHIMPRKSETAFVPTPINLQKREMEAIAKKILEKS